MLVTALSGCAKIKEGEDALTQLIASVFFKDKVSGGNSTNTGKDKDDKDKNKLKGIPTKLSAEKIGSFAHDDFYLDVCDGGIIYSKNDNDNKKYGFVSFDGKFNSGATYDYVKSCGDYFTVMPNASTSKDDATSYNRAGLYDAQGNALLEAKYFNFKSLNEQYIQVYEATDFTTDKDSALMYITDSFISFEPDEEDLLFVGKWSIYDVKNKRFVEGATGTKAYSVSCYGQFISYYDDNDNRVEIDADGKALPEDATIFENGTYRVDGEKDATVYDNNYKKLFSYSLDDYESISYDSTGDCYTTYKYNGTDDGTYSVMDYDGKVVSKDFKDSVNVTGDIIYSNEKLYDFDGNSLFDKSVKYVNIDQFGQVYRITDNDENEYLIDATGAILCTQTKNDESISMSFLPYKHTDDKYMYFSYKDKDFTIDGTSSVAECAVQTSSDDNGNKKLIDAFSGNVLLEGYTSYEDNNETTEGIIVAAKQADSDNWDVYRITAE